MFHFQLQRFAAAVVFCGLFFQGCESGLRAVIRETGTRQAHKTSDHECSANGASTVVSGAHAQFSHLSSGYPDAHDQLPLASSSPSAPPKWCPPFAAVPALSVVSQATSPVHAADVSHIQFVSESFTTSSGERVSFSKQGGRWQATLQYGAGACMYERTLPVVSADNIETLLMRLQRQDVWASRSRIHVMATAHPAHAPLCVYLGKVGLLGGMPVQQIQSVMPREWHTAPGIVMCGSDTTQTRVFHIPQGYRYKEWRLKPGAVMEHASLTVRHVEANSREAIYELASLRYDRLCNTVLTAGIGKIVDLGTISTNTQCAPVLAPRDQRVSYFTHAAVVLHGSTHGSELLREEGKMDIELEVCIERDTKIKILDVSEERARLQDAQVQLQLGFASDLEREGDSGVLQTSQEQIEVQLNKLSQECACLEEGRLYQASVPSLAFGKYAWEHYFGEVGTEPRLPANIGEILNSPCPFWPEKAIKETHLLVLIPSTVDNKAFTLNLLDELMQSPKRGGQSTRYCHYDNDVKLMLGEQAVSRPYWVLMTRDVLPNSRSQTHEDQKALVAACARNLGIPYEMPHVLDVATAVVSCYVRTGERLYTDNPCTYTRCKEIIADEENDEYPVIVGGFSPEGLSIRSCFNLNALSGASCCLRF